MHSPALNCPLCPRLSAFHEANRQAYPSFHNAPVPAFGELSARLLIVGLAPGLKGANQTGRPFTGDYAGLVLYQSLLKHGLAEGTYKERADDGLTLRGCRITNAVRCVPPQNKPEPSEIRTCNRFLEKEIAAMPHLRAILTLGQIAHKAVLMALGLKASAYDFAHGAEHPHVPVIINSYHCSRYNINTRTLTQAMFDEVMGKAKNRAGG